MIYIKLFLTYLKIGLFSFGGGYAMLSFIHNEIVDKHHWITTQEFTDIIAVSQMTPGPVGINTATYVGYTVTGNVFGSILATLAVCLPSFVIVLIFSYFYKKFKENKTLESIFEGIRLVVIGLIASAAIMLINKETFIDRVSIVLFVEAFIMVKWLKISPILLIIITGLFGFFYYYVFST